MQANRGTKRRCGECGANFYDLDRTPIVCPKCQAAYVAAAPRVPARSSGRPAPRAVVPEVHEEMAVEADTFAEDEVLSHDIDEEEEVVPDDEAEEGGDSAFTE